MQVCQSFPAGGGVTPLFHAANASGETSGSGSMTLTTTAVSTVLVAHVARSRPSSVTLDGTTGTDNGSINSGKYLSVYRWDNVPAGSHTITVTGGDWYSLSAGAYTGVSTAAAGVTATGTTAAVISGASATDVIVSAFGGSSAMTVTSGTRRASNQNGDDSASAIIDAPGGSDANAATNGRCSVTIRLS